MTAKHCNSLKDLTGQKFNRLLVIGKSERKSKAGAMWRCLCDCGNESHVVSLKIRTGKTQSCGCLKKHAMAKVNVKHGLANKTRTYRTWKEMRYRCKNPNSDKWKWYGGRGISVCDKWNDYTAFLEDMGERPQSHTLDRINPDGNYEPGNCRWATAKQQAETNRGCFKPGKNHHT